MSSIAMQTACLKWFPQFRPARDEQRFESGIVLGSLGMDLCLPPYPDSLPRENVDKVDLDLRIDFDIRNRCRRPHFGKGDHVVIDNHEGPLGREVGPTVGADRSDVTETPCLDHLSCGVRSVSCCRPEAGRKRANVRGSDLATAADDFDPALDPSGRMGRCIPRGRGRRERQDCPPCCAQA